MKIQLASELHLEFLVKRFPYERLITPNPDADVLVLAGDISTGVKAIELFLRLACSDCVSVRQSRIYRHDYDQAVPSLRVAAEGTSIYFLERNRVDLDGIHFLGCCVWNDYELGGRTATSRPLAMTVTYHEIYDQTAIRRNGGRFSPNMV